MITIDWANKIINVPKDFTTLIQSNPSEIREMNLNDFRLALKDLEDNEEGMTFLDTHSHNSDVIIGGITLAMVIEIINGYTITFENGQYSVNLVGANSNVGDRINANQVSVRSNNSAGLTSLPSVEYSSFNGGVTIDQTNGFSGVLYPTGTPLKPVNNIIDAKLIQINRGLPKILFPIGELEFTEEDVLTEFTIRGINNILDHVHINSGGTLTSCQMEKLHISGYFSGNTIIDNCELHDVYNLTGKIHNSLLSGTLEILSGTTVEIVNCSSVDALTTVNSNGSGNCVASKHTGNLTIINKTSGESIFDYLSGEIFISSGCTGGSIKVRGICEVVDQSSGTTVDISGTVVVGPDLNANIVIIKDQLDDNLYNIKLILGLVGRNFRIGEQVYNAQGNIISCKTIVYDTKEDCENEVNPLSSHSVLVTYDGSGKKVTNYKAIADD